MGLLDNLTPDDAARAAKLLAPLAGELAPPFGPVLAAAVGLAEDIVGYVAEDRRDAVLEKIRVQLRAGVFDTIQREIEEKFPNG